ncbi:conserved hypothetical protein [groundwater metagenome]|uniref:Spore protein YkvP/CgeB glycosyl transferase-like domain-containing protein n=1 Tax=groundwater metagenome TaxID=717931 RepID=A0A098EE75_9ZZZZ
MKILIVDTYYEGFLKTFYKENEEKIETLNYSELRQLLFNQFFGTSDFYSKNLKKIGVEAEEVIFNDSVLQSKWIEEQKINLKLGEPFYLKSFGKIGKKIDRIFNFGYLYKILSYQIESYQPDILYIISPTYFSPFFLGKLKKKIKFLIAQIAAPLPPLWFFRPYDLVISSQPHYVKFFRDNKIKSEYLKLAFEHDVLNYVKKNDSQYPITFIGSFTKFHEKNLPIFEEVSKNFKDKFLIRGYITQNIKTENIKRCYRGESFGLDMYNVLYNSKITLNRHGEVSISQQYANNMRLFEATGMGAFLITDYKENLNDLFRIGKEIETYTDTKELIKKIQYYLDNEDERKKIAEAGQRRTLTDHTYEKRMKELIKIIEKYF